MFGPDAALAGRLQVKICGITNAADAQAAITAGADALGFNCYAQSKRYIDLAAAAEWIERLPREIGRIAVLVDPNWDEAIATARLPFITALQLHGRETAEFCARLAEAGIRFGKALPAMESGVLQNPVNYSTRTILLDSISGGSFGGTGATFPWRIASDLVISRPDLQVVLAGGLSPTSVREAVRTVRPFGVDVTSGVELSPGRKDHQKVSDFIRAARLA